MVSSKAGKKTKKIEEKYGPEKLASWRWILNQARLKGKVLKAVYLSGLCPIFGAKSSAAIKEEKNVIICAHQGSLRALVQVHRRHI